MCKYLVQTVPSQAPLTPQGDEENSNNRQQGETGRQLQADNQHISSGMFYKQTDGKIRLQTNIDKL